MDASLLRLTVLPRFEALAQNVRVVRAAGPDAGRRAGAVTGVRLVWLGRDEAFLTASGRAHLFMGRDGRLFRLTAFEGRDAGGPRLRAAGRLEHVSDDVLRHLDRAPRLERGRNVGALERHAPGLGA